MNKIFKLLILLTMFVLISGCASTPPTQKQIEAYRSIETLRTVVDQSYGDAEGVTLPFEDVARKIIKGCSEVNVVSADAEIYVATLAIKAMGSAYGKSYVEWWQQFSRSTDRIYLYTGASLKGSISLKMKGVPSYKAVFLGVRRPPRSLPGSKPYPYRTPSTAPFGDVFNMEGSYMSTLFELMGHIYSNECIIAALKNEDVDVRRNAAYVLGRKGYATALEPLIARLKYEDVDVRRQAADVLGWIGHASAVEPLIALLKDKNGYVRISAANALGRIGDPSAVEPLIAAMEDSRRMVPVPEVWWRQKQALKKITGENFHSASEWYRWWRDNKQKYLTTS